MDGKLNRLEQRIRAIINNSDLEDAENTMSRIRMIAEGLEKPLLAELVRRRHTVRKQDSRGFKVLLWSQAEAILLEAIGDQLPGWASQYEADLREMLTHDSYLLRTSESELLTNDPRLVTVAIGLGSLMDVHQMDPGRYDEAKRRRTAVLERLVKWLRP